MSVPSILLEVILNNTVHILIVFLILEAIFEVFLSETTQYTLRDEFLTISDSLIRPLEKKIEQLPRLQKCSVQRALRMLSNLQDDTTSCTILKNKLVQTSSHRFFAMNVFFMCFTLVIVSLALNIYQKDFIQKPTATQGTFFSWYRILEDSAITLFILTVFELYFVKTIATQYVPADETVLASVAKNRILQNIHMTNEQPGYKWQEVSESSVFVEDNGELYTKIQTAHFWNGTYCLKNPVSIHGLSIVKSNNKYYKPVLNSDLPPLTSSTPIVAELWTTSILLLTLLIGMFVVVAYLNNVEENNNMERLAQTVVGVVSMCVTAGVVYFTYGVQAKQKTMERESEMLVDYVMGLARSMEKEFGLTDLVSSFQNVDIPTSKAEEINRHNDAIEKKAKLHLVICVCVCVIILFVSTLVTKQNKFVHVFKSIASILIGACVAFSAEYVFVNSFVANIDVVDSRDVTNHTVSNLIKKLGHSCPKNP